MCYIGDAWWYPFYYSYVWYVECWCCEYNVAYLTLTTTLAIKINILIHGY